MSDLSRVEQLLRNALGEDIYNVSPMSRIEELLVQLNELIEDGGGSVSPEDIETAVSAYLDEHLTNPTNPPIDTSLSITGAAADSKATGDKLSDLKEGLNVFRPTATSADVGKALIVKTVADGVPTEFEYGEAGVSEKEFSAHDNRVDALIDASQVSLDFDIVIGSYISGTGQILKETGSLYTSKIQVIPSETLTLHAEWAEYPNQFRFDLVQYDSAGEFLRKNIAISALNPDQLAVYDGSITVPSDVYFIALDNFNGKSVNMDTVVRLYRPWELEERVSATEQDIENIQASLNGVYIAERLDATTEIETSGSPQLFNKDSYPVRDYGTSYNYYHNCYIDFTQNGKYYINPLGSAQIVKAYPYDANDTRLSLNGNASGYFGWGEYYVVERVDDTHIRAFAYTSKTNFENDVVSQIADYEVGGTVAKLKFEFFRNLHFGDSMDLGIVYGKPISYYVPYGVNIKYRQDMYDGVWDGFVDNNKFRNIPSKCLNPWMQRSYALTDNLVDDRKFDWTKTKSVGSNVFRLMKNGETVPVIGGKTIVCAKRLYSVKTYDSNGVETALSTVISENTPYTLASDVVAIRFDVGVGTGAHQIPADTYEPIYLYYADDTLYPLDDVDRNPVPMAQINGWDINKNVYDMAIPEVDSNIVRMMKTFAIRELNHQRDAFRIGTFNIYINNTRNNRPTIKKELETYGIDICCFQEARNLSDNNEQLNIGDYLKGWQFRYCNTNAGVSSNGRAMVSAYEILSSEEVTFTDNTSNSYLKSVIKLPTFKHYMDGDTTLSLYTYHGNVASATTRLAEVTQMLSAIAQDTSDFIVVTGDTNDFSENKDVWELFKTAGLTPVHDGESATVTSPSGPTYMNSIDNIFISSHITCLYYDVVKSNDWKYTPAGVSTPIPVSDHDFLYADLQFDFEAVLSARQ